MPSFLDLRSELAAEFGDSYGSGPLGAKIWFVVHHWAADPPEGTSPRDLSRMTARYHTQTKRWPGHGYQFEIAPDGTIMYTGSVESIRANVAGLNHGVIGASLVGNMSQHPPTDAQIASLRWLRYESGLIPPLEVVGHGDIALPGNGTTCPGTTWPQWKSAVLLA